MPVRQEFVQIETGERRDRNGSRNRFPVENMIVNATLVESAQFAI